jgi:8-oxo-dGTP pyrophosphatase MutT (NUDIX family)
MKTRYVAGFLFDREGTEVALIEKQRPEWQRGYLNGVGGHIEKKTGSHICYDVPCDQTNFDPCICPWETPAEAMRREFFEETGVDLDRWKEYVVLSGPRFEVHFFHAYGDEIEAIDTKTDEQVAQYPVDVIIDPSIHRRVITNLRWLIPMALTMIYEPNVVKFTVVQEELVYA